MDRGNQEAETSVNWIIIEQNKWGEVSYKKSDTTTVFFIEYDRCVHPEYVRQKLEEIRKLGELDLVDMEDVLAMEGKLEQYIVGGKF